MHYDQVGTLRAMTDAVGNVVKEVQYDSFGNVLNDTRPGMSHFAFAGGLYDGDTGLVRFGYRDYDAKVGVWTAKDPILFNGGLIDIYGYVNNMPTQAVDPLGLDVTVSYYNSATGHVGFSVPGDNGSTGFYPNAGYPYTPMRPGVVKPDEGTPTACKVIPATPDQDDCMRKCRDTNRAKPPIYSLLSMQCTSFVRNCLSECGLPSGTPGISYPQPWFLSL